MIKMIKLAMLLTCLFGVNLAYATDFYCYAPNFISSISSSENTEQERGLLEEVFVEQLRRKKGVSIPYTRGRIDQPVTCKYGNGDKKILESYEQDRIGKEAIELDFDKVNFIVVYCEATTGTRLLRPILYSSRLFTLPKPRPHQAVSEEFYKFIESTYPGIDEKDDYLPKCHIYGNEDLAKVSKAYYESTHGAERMVSVDYPPARPVADPPKNAVAKSKKSTEKAVLRVIPNNVGPDAATIARNKAMDDAATARAAAAKAKQEAEGRINDAKNAKEQRELEKRKRDALISCYGSVEAAKTAKTTCQ